MKFKNFKIKKKFSSFISQLSSSNGQALVMLLFFIVISITILSSAAIILLINFASVSREETGTSAYYLSETGIENALLRLVRDPAYQGETLNTYGGTIVIEVSGYPPVIVSTAKIFNSMKKIQAETTFNNNVLNISSWKEIY